MNYKILTDNGSASATLWFLGWGFDDNIEQYINPTGTTILLWDYSDLNLSLDLGRWSEFDVKAWSMGVWAAESFLAAHPDLHITSRTAIAGTPRPADAAQGIGAEAIQLTISNWCDANRAKFARKIAHSAALTPTVAALMTTRSLDSQSAELQHILDAQSATQPEPTTWDVAIIGSRDRIFPPASQHAWWDSHAHQVIDRDMPHWPF